MTSETARPIVPVAEDDPDDQLLLREAVEEAGLAATVDFVMDGIELLRTLRRSAELAERGKGALPALIVLDLNMPRMDGGKTLKELKADPSLARIPVVVLSTSRDPDDIMVSGDRVAAAYFTKPTSFEELVTVAASFPSYWREPALPPIGSAMASEQRPQMITNQGASLK